ncbi:hypothetical protein [Microvirga puerhi]|uniref:Uncharacterized protein n=1 Tax=Microvirga puerhi TaxID=2876078 RepID=A0ABS7VUV8_9HYPH|nr:hypothetical protein [Microvirga puerhi]MBZ6078910.1 hypothetical protein [Microvirga puerhi]
MTTEPKKYNTQPRTAFRRLMIDHFGKEEIKVACSYFDIGRQTYWGWDQKGGPPPRLKGRIADFLESNGIALPVGKTVDDFLRKKKRSGKGKAKKDASPIPRMDERIRRRREAMNSAFAAHFRQALATLGPDTYHSVLEMERPDMNLSNAARWAFELGGVPPTQLPTYVRALFNHGYFRTKERSPSFSEVLMMAQAWRLPSSSED